MVAASFAAVAIRGESVLGRRVQLDGELDDERLEVMSRGGWWSEESGRGREGRVPRESVQRLCRR